MKITNLLFIALLAAPVFASACREGAGERAGEKLDRGAQKTGDVLEDVGDKTEDAVDKAN
jgi:hypothetical protein